MSNLQCPKCGLSNRSTHRQCLRCYTPLEALEGFHAPQPTIGQNLRKRKLLIAAALLGLLVVVGLTAAYKFTGPKKVPNPNAALEAALSSSPDFNVPVMVDAARYSFQNLGEHRFDQEATPAAYTLETLGMLYIHNGMYSDTPMTRSRDGNGYMVDPATGLSFDPYRHVELELTQSGQAQSSLWEPYKNKATGSVGWKVPIGERQFGRVIQVMPLSNQPLEDAAMVSFTWKWKPNEVGQSFDKQNPAYVKSKGPLTFPREPSYFDVDDSHVVYWGTADLQRMGGRWEVSRVIWIGTGGVRLVPNQIEEIDRMMEEQRRQSNR